jgi:hypothetical protein
MRPLLLSLSLLSITAFAQDPAFVFHTPRAQYLFPDEAPRAYILGNNVALRETPARTGQVATTLNAGTPVYIEEMTTDTLIVNGVGSYWYRVTAGDHHGWTWGGNIAQVAFGSTADATVKFVGGIDHITPSDTGMYDHSYRLIALKDGKEIDRIVVRSFAWSFEMVTNLGDRGLHAVDDIIALNVPCVGGCGCTTGDVLVFWSGGRFHHAADLMGSPDGAYSTNVSFIFPADMEGLPNVIIREELTYSEIADEPLEDTNREGEEVTEDQPADEADDTDQEYISRITTRTYLTWNGKALVPSGRAPETSTYRLALD